MAAVVRVKRSLDEEPTEVLVLSCKRRRTDADEETSVNTLFKFAGTVHHPEDDISHIFLNETTRKLPKNVRRNSSNVLQKARDQTKLSSERSRYKLVNYFRASSEEIEHSVEDTIKVGKPFTVLDVETHSQKKSESKPAELETDSFVENSPAVNYVYDLYRMQLESEVVDVDDLLLDGLVSFAPLESPLVFDSYRNNRVGGSDSDSPDVDDEDDSNDENNWRNDYPDEDEGRSDSEEDLLASRVGNVRFGDEELSSDGDDEHLIYGEDLAVKDVNLFGPAYASFKKKVQQELTLETEISSDSSDYSGSDRLSNAGDESVESRYE